MSEPSRFQEERAHGQYLAHGDTEDLWGWGTPAGQARARRRAAFIAQRARLRPGMSVLEVGCGTGLFTGMFAAHGCRILAVDISPDLMEKARARNLPAELVSFDNVNFEAAALRGPFAAVIGSSVLHHLSIPASLRTIFGLLAPGGTLCFAEPNMLNPQVFAERRFRRFFPYVSPSETAFVRWSLRRSLLESGFASCTLEPFDWLHPATPRVLIPAVERLNGVLEVLPLVREFAGSLLITARRP